MRAVLLIALLFVILVSQDARAHSPAVSDATRARVSKESDQERPLSGKARFDLATHYLSLDGPENRSRALKLLRSIVNDGQEDVMIMTDRHDVSAKI